MAEIFKLLRKWILYQRSIFSYGVEYMNIFCSKGVIVPLSSGLRNLLCLMAPSTCLYGAHNRVLDHLLQKGGHQHRAHGQRL